jgi:hypothetical protein
LGLAKSFSHIESPETIADSEIQTCVCIQCGIGTRKGLRAGIIRERD